MTNAYLWRCKICVSHLIGGNFLFLVFFEAPNYVFLSSLTIGRSFEPSTFSMDFWKFADAVTNAVKEQTTELAHAVQSTDWSAELLGLQQGIQEETKTLSQNASKASKQLSERALEAANSLPLRRKSRKEDGELETEDEGIAATMEELWVGSRDDGNGDGGMFPFGGDIGRLIVESGSKALDQVASTLEHAVEASRKFSMVDGSASNRDTATEMRLREQIAAMQRDCSVYCQEPSDIEDFQKWSVEFDIDSHESEIADILGENTFMRELQSRIVPVLVDRRTFWTRYFYNVYKLEQDFKKKNIPLINTPPDSNGLTSSCSIAQETAGYGNGSEDVGASSGGARPSMNQSSTQEIDGEGLEQEDLNPKGRIEGIIADVPHRREEGEEESEEKRKDEEEEQEQQEAEEKNQRSKERFLDVNTSHQAAPEDDAAVERKAKDTLTEPTADDEDMTRNKASTIQKDNIATQDVDAATTLHIDGNRNQQRVHEEVSETSEFDRDNERASSLVGADDGMKERQDGDDDDLKTKAPEGEGADQWIDVDSEYEDWE